jgi:hypothetical protein
MIISLGQCISSASALAGARTDWSPSEISFYANVALQEVTTRIHYSGKEAFAISSVTSGEGRIGLPSDFDYPLTVKLQSYSVSTTTTSDEDDSVVTTAALQWSSQLTLKDYSELDGQEEVTGQPLNYGLYNNWLELFPGPNSAYSLTLRYAAKQPTLMLSTDTPSIDERWHPAWLYRTEYYLRKSRDDSQGAAEANSQYVNYISSTPHDRAWRQQAKTQQGVRMLRSR